MGRTKEHLRLMRFIFLTPVYLKLMVIELVIDKRLMQPDNIIPPLAGKP